MGGAGGTGGSEGWCSWGGASSVWGCEGLEISGDSEVRFFGFEGVEVVGDVFPIIFIEAFHFCFGGGWFLDSVELEVGLFFIC